MQKRNKMPLNVPEDVIYGVYSAIGRKPWGNTPGLSLVQEKRPTGPQFCSWWLM
jgi:hypothetical protein